MSRYVDERVVEMGFDNKRFETNVRQSMSTLDELNEKLEFSGVQSGNQALSAINETILSVEKSFSALEVAMITVIANITNKITNLAVDSIKALTVDNIAEGWNKYGQETTAVGTLMAQTIRMTTDELDENGKAIVKVIDEADKMSTITEQLEKLNWYTDETSYTFTDMVDNIGKFTAAGNSLNDSVDAMMGIANWAALSGQNAQTASRAMYQLSQAMSSGTVRLQDYRSIQTANMDTEEFRQTALQTALDLGTLERSISGVYRVGDKTFTEGQFTEFLSEGWFTSDVLMKTLKKYSSTTDALYEAYSDPENTKTTSELIEEMSGSLDAFGLKAFRAAQEARTFQDAVGSIKEAVASGWMNTFNKVFGDYEEAKTLWTDLANELYDVFAEPGNVRNEILGVWKEWGGRDDIFGRYDEETRTVNGAFWNLYDAIIAVKNIVSEAWDAIFPAGTIEERAAKLHSITQRLRDITQGLILTGEKAEKLKDIFTGVFSVIRTGARVVKSLWDGTKPIRDFVKETLVELFEGIANVGKSFTEASEDGSKFEKLTEKLTKISEAVVGVLKAAVLIVKDIVAIGKKLFGLIRKVPGELNKIFTAATGSSFSITDILTSVLGLIERAILMVHKFFSVFSDVDTGPMEKVSTSLSEKLSPLKKFFDGVANLFKGLWEIVKAVAPVIGTILGYIGDWIKKLGEKIKAVFSGQESLASLKDLFSGAFLGAMVTYWSWFLAQFMSWNQTFKAVVQGFGDMFDSKAVKTYLEGLRQFAISIAIVVAAVIALASVDRDKIVYALATMAVLIAGMLGVFKILQKMSKPLLEGMGNMKKMSQGFQFKQIVASLIRFALAIAIMALAVKVLSTVSVADTVKGVLALTVLAGTMLLFIFALNKLKISKVTKGLGSLVLIAVAMLILAAPIKIIGSMKLGDIAKGVLAIVAILAVVTAISWVLKKTSPGALLVFALSMDLLAAAMIGVATAIAIIKFVDKDSVVKAFTVITGLLAVCTIIAKVLKIGEAATFLVFALAMDFLSAAMMALSVAVFIMNGISAEGVWNSLLVMGGLLALGALIGKFLTIGDAATLLIFSAAMAIISGAFVIIAGAAAIMAAIPVDSLIIGLVALGIILALATVAGMVLGVYGGAALILVGVGLAAIGASLIVTAAGILALAGALAVLAKIGWGEILGGLAKLTVALLILTVVGVVFSLAAIVFILFAAAMGIAAIACGAFAAAIGAVALACQMFLAIQESMHAVIAGLATFIPEILTIIGQSILNFFTMVLTWLLENSELIATTIFTVIDNLLSALAEHAPSIAESVWTILRSLWDNWVARLPEVVAAFIQLLIDFIDAIKEKIPPLREAIVDFLLTMVENFITAIVDVIVGSADRFVKGIIYLINSIADSIEENTPLLVEAVNRLGKAIMNALKAFFGINSPAQKLIDIGKYIIDGLVNGIVNFGKNVWSKIKGVFTGIWDGIKNVFSGAVNLGKSVVEGIKNGIQGVGEAAKNIGTGFVDGVKNAAGAVKDAAVTVGGWFQDTFNNLFGIHSPSVWAMQEGKFVDEGFSEGIEDNTNVVENAASGIFDGLSAKFSSGIDQLKKSLNIDDTISNFAGSISNGLNIKDLTKNLGLSDTIADNLLANDEMSDEVTEIPCKVVMDMSEYDAQMKEIEAMKKGSSTIDINGTTYGNAEATSSAVASNKAASEGSDSTNPNVASATVSESAGGITNTFYISGNNPKEIADEVSKIIQKQIDRRKAVWET